MFDGLIVDLFAGGGGASIGIERATGRAVDVAVNHDPDSIAMHAANHPHTLHLCSDVWEVDPLVATGGRPVDLLWASPDCRHFSKAKGGKPVSKKIRGLAWVVIRWAAAVRPRVICLENVEEFKTWGPLGDDGRPCPRRKGRTFRSWTGQLRKLGYDVQWRELRACDYGAPTTRKRLFLVARRDGLPIVWPEPTHGPGLKPYRTAAECIDWSIPCPSIFARKKPLAEKTQRRIAMGLKRYVLDNPRPFIVNVQHGGDEFRGQAIDAPLSTVTKKRGYGVVVPFLAQNYGEAPHQQTRGQAVVEPIRTVTPANNTGVLVAPYIAQMNFGDKQWHPVDAGLTTVTSQGNKHLLVAPFLAKHYGGVVGHGVERPIGTVTAIDHHSLVTPFIAKHYGGDRGNCAGRAIGVDGPVGTITTSDHHSLVAPILVGAGGPGYSGKPRGIDVPFPTVIRENHSALVAAFLIKYFGQGCGSELSDPAHTVTSRDRFGLVTVTIDGQPYAIVDIGLRMLSPRELARAQGFPDDYVLTGSKSNQVARIGNSVCPQLAEAIVRANVRAPVAEGRAVA